MFAKSLSSTVINAIFESDYAAFYLHALTRFSHVARSFPHRQPFFSHSNYRKDCMHSVGFKSTREKNLLGSQRNSPPWRRLDKTIIRSFHFSILCMEPRGLVERIPEKKRCKSLIHCVRIDHK
jgi:hypothetical protein